MPQYQSQFDYEWMDAFDQLSKVFGDWLPVLQGYGFIPSSDQPNDAAPNIAVQPMPPVPVPPQPQQPAPSLAQLIEQVPPWAWALGGVVAAALLFRK